MLQMRSRILILCTGNSARSQMAEGILRAFDARLEVFSAGTEPAARVHPGAIEAMREIGIDISGAAAKSVSPFLNRSFDHVITVCGDADRNCPTFTGKVGKRVHIGFVDPAAAAKEDVPDTFRRVRDEIKSKLSEYYEKEINTDGDQGNR